MQLWIRSAEPPGTHRYGNITTTITRFKHNQLERAPFLKGSLTVYRLKTSPNLSFIKKGSKINGNQSYSRLTCIKSYVHISR